MNTQTEGKARIWERIKSKTYPTVEAYLRDVQELDPDAIIGDEGRAVIKFSDGTEYDMQHGRVIK